MGNKIHSFVSLFLLAFKKKWNMETMIDLLQQTHQETEGSKIMLLF